MLKADQILVSGRVGVALMVVVLSLGAAACGQRGPLYLPKDDAAKNRATLPELMTPRMPGRTGAPTTELPAPNPPSDAGTAPGLGR